MHGQGVTAPHLVDMELDPIWRYHDDVTSRHADPECTVYAFGMPADMPNWDEPRINWVEMIVCAEFDVDDDPDDPRAGAGRIATDWDYYVYLRGDDDTQTEDSGALRWPEARAYLYKLFYAKYPEDAQRHAAFRRSVGLVENPVKARLLRWR